MVQSLGLEEQEQLAQLKHFWARYGNFITWLLILVFASIAAWNGWNYWQHKQAQGASVLFDQVERAAADKDTNRLSTALTDLQGQYGRTAFAQQGALLAARGFMDAGDAAKAAGEAVAGAAASAAADVGDAAKAAAGAAAAAAAAAVTPAK